jgi:hypothetical protein
VKVDHSTIILRVDLSGFQIDRQHIGGTFGHTIEYRLSAGLAGNPWREPISQRPRDRLYRLSLVLGVTCADNHCWRIGGQVEPLRGQALEFVPAQPGSHRERVQHGAIRAGHVDDHRTGHRGFDQLGRLIRSQRTADASTIRFGAPGGEMREKMLSSPSIAP